MYNYIQKVRFFKNTYGKLFLVRVEFEVKIPENCLFVADNICQCDHWFAKDSSVELKYDIIFSGDFDTEKPRFIKKSIVVDLNKPIYESGFIELIITNYAGLSDIVRQEFTELKNDPIKKPLN